MDEANEELAVRYVMGELSPSEERRFDAKRTYDRELDEFARDMQEAFASMALAVPPLAPPSDLPARIVRASPKGKGNRSANLAPTPRNIIRLEFLPWALAACFAAACAVLAVDRLHVGKELADSRNREASLQGELADLRQRDVLSQVRIATLQSQVAAYARTRAVVVWDSDRKSGLIQFTELPAPEPGKNYQLWVIDPRVSHPVSAGLVPPAESGLVRVDFKPARPVESAAQFAVSVEDAGGSPTPRGKIILLSQ